MTCTSTNASTATPSAANSAADAGDVLARLTAIVERTPRNALVTHPISRTLLAEACQEIRRLRTEHDQLLSRKEVL